MPHSTWARFVLNACAPDAAGASRATLAQTLSPHIANPIERDDTLNWHPLTAAALAALPTVCLETNLVSAQLDRLSRDGIVEKAPTPPGDKLRYQIAERFFNIWYLMRASRRLRRKLVWLVDFLTLLYAPPELHARAQRFLRSETMSQHAEMTFAYAQSVHEPTLRHALINHESLWPDIITFFKEAVRTDHAADAVALLDSIGYVDRWHPLREALRAIAVGSDAPLLHVAPEIRQPAAMLMAQLLPEGVTMASALKAPRARQASRRRRRQ